MYTQRLAASHRSIITDQRPWPCLWVHQLWYISTRLPSVSLTGCMPFPSSTCRAGHHWATAGSSHWDSVQCTLSERYCTIFHTANCQTLQGFHLLSANWCQYHGRYSLTCYYCYYCSMLILLLMLRHGCFYLATNLVLCYLLSLSHLRLAPLLNYSIPMHGKCKYNYKMKGTIKSSVSIIYRALLNLEVRSRWLK